MPLRASGSGSFDEEALSLLEAVLETVSPTSDALEVRDFYASRLIQLFQAGVTDADELVARLRRSSADVPDRDQGEGLKK